MKINSFLLWIILLLIIFDTTYIIISNQKVSKENSVLIEQKIFKYYFPIEFNVLNYTEDASNKLVENGWYVDSITSFEKKTISTIFDSVGDVNFNIQWTVGYDVIIKCSKCRLGEK